jgi:hypothetical protein
MEEIAHRFERERKVSKQENIVKADSNTFR